MEEPIEYGKPKYKIGDNVSFPWFEQVMVGTITSVLTTERGYAYAIKTPEGGNYESDEECVLPIYGVSYVADKPMETPEHYKMAITPIEFIEKNQLGFSVGNVIKYVCRYKHKNGKEDLLKAKHYIDLILQYEYPDLEIQD